MKPFQIHRKVPVRVRFAGYHSGVLAHLFLRGLILESATRVQDGTIIAPSPGRGVVNPYLQHRHLLNLFILAALTFPNQGCASPTPALMVFAHQGAAALVDHYPKTPGQMA